MTPRVGQLRLLASLLLWLAWPAAAAHAQGVLDQVDEARRAGEDERALALLERTSPELSGPRRAAERGLAYQGLGRYVEAERSLVEALASRRDPWVVEHRAGLDLALRLTRERLGWLIVACDDEGTRASLRNEERESFPCDLPQRVIAGEHEIEVEAPERRSLRVSVSVAPGARLRYAAALEPFECESEGMLHMGGAGGACCWPGQSFDGSCSGAPTCPPNTAAQAGSCVPTQRRARGLASFTVGAFAGVAAFASADTSLFRPGVDAGGASTQVGARLELRLGARIYGPLSAVVVVGGSRQDVNRWLECGTAGCVDTGPTAFGVDVGLMLQLHTNPRRHLGAFDLHLGVGVRPYARILFDSSTAGQAAGKLTATVVPAELGLSLYLGAAASIDLVGQGELWLPREYCGEAPDGTKSCLGSASLQRELGGSVLLGFSLHLGG